MKKEGKLVAVAVVVMAVVVMAVEEAMAEVGVVTIHKIYFLNTQWYSVSSCDLGCDTVQCGT
jgi:hypothetical protein